MRRKIKVNRRAQIIYLPDEVINELVPGQDSQIIDAYCDAITFTLVKQGVSLQQVKKSLEVVIQDINMRIDVEKGEAREAAKEAVAR